MHHTKKCRLYRHQCRRNLTKWPTTCCDVGSVKFGRRYPGAIQIYPPFEAVSSVSHANYPHRIAAANAYPLLPIAFWLINYNMNLTLKIWRQANTTSKGEMVTYPIENVSPDMSFLEMMDVLNEQLINKGIDGFEFYCCKKRVPKLGVNSHFLI